jgi:phosphoribosylaminoimidazole (AIR) synthetase
MEHTFNSGLGMIAVVGKDRLDACARLLERRGERFSVIGEIEKGETGVDLVS